MTGKIFGINGTLLSSSQEYKEQLVNELIRLTSVASVPVISSVLTTPPSSGLTPDSYFIVPLGATGAWAGRTNQIAYPLIGVNGQPNGDWGFWLPFTGVKVSLVSGSDLYFTGTDWQAGDGGTGVTDGDKGDVIVSNSGATWSVETGTTANSIVRLDNAAKLPAIDGSQLTNLPSGEDSWPITILALIANDQRLEGTNFPKTLTLPPFPTGVTINKISGLINSLNSGSAVISIQNGTTNISGLNNLTCTTTVLADQLATANNILSAGGRLRISFSSITGLVNISFRIDYTENP